MLRSQGRKVTGALRKDHVLVSNVGPEAGKVAGVPIKGPDAEVTRLGSYWCPQKGPAAGVLSGARC
jgi:hypothetical protein